MHRTGAQEKRSPANIFGSRGTRAASGQNPAAERVRG